MPVSYIHQDEHVYINVWDITEEESFFTDSISLLIEDTSIDYNNISHKQARMQYLASRYLLATMLNQNDKICLYKSDFGKVYIKDQSINISISHADNKVAVAFSSLPIGIDIECINRNVSRVKHKFVNQDEEKWVQNTEDVVSVWSSKEVVFKIYEKKEVDFLKHITIKPLSNNRYEAFFNKNQLNKKYFLQKFNLENYIIICGYDFDFVVL